VPFSPKSQNHAPGESKEPRWRRNKRQGKIKPGCADFVKRGYIKKAKARGRKKVRAREKRQDFVKCVTSKPKTKPKRTNKRKKEGRSTGRWRMKKVKDSVRPRERRQGGG